MPADDKLTYDAFMSYSHSTDAALAPVLQRLIHRVGRPWFRRSTLRVFRDSTSLTTTADMWAGIVSAMAGSRYFILMASPAAAQSPWVQREIAYWREHREPWTFFIVLTEGVIVWDGRAGDFDWSQTSALPADVLRGAFPAEPLWEDVSGARGTARRGQRNVRLRDAARTLAAPMHGVPKDLLDGEDERESRRARRFLQGSVSALAVLLALAVVLATVAFVERNSAVDQLRNATARAIAAESTNLAVRDPILSAQLALLSYEAAPSPQSTAALMAAVEGNRHVLHHLEREASSDGTYARDGRAAVTGAKLSADGLTLAGVSGYTGQVQLWDVRSGAVLGTLTSQQTPDGAVPPLLFFTDNGRLAVLFSSGVDIWDLRTQQRVQTAAISTGSPVAVSPDGGLVALVDDTESTGSVLDLSNPSSPPQIVTRGPGSAAAIMELVTGHRPSVDSLFPDLPRDYLDSSADGRTAAVLTDNTTLELWDVPTSALIARTSLPGDPGWLSVGLSGDATSVVVGNDQGELVRFDGALRSPIPLGQLPAAVGFIGLDDRGDTAVALDVLGNVDLLRPAQDQRFDVLPSSAGGAGKDDSTQLVASPDGRWLAVIRAGMAEVWDVAAQRRLESVPVRADPSDPTVAFSGDGSRIAAVQAGRVVTWELPDMREVADDATVDPLDVARALRRGVGGIQVAATTDGATNRVWAVFATGERVLGEVDRTDTSSAMGVTTGRASAVVDATGTGRDVLTAYDFGGPEPVVTSTITESDTVVGLAVGDRGRRLVFGRTHLDLTTGARVPLSGGDGLASGFSSVFVNDEQNVVRQVEPTRYATGSIRTSLLVWDVSAGTLIGQWPEPQQLGGLGPVSPPLAAVGQGSVATVRPDGSVALWDVSPQSWVRRLCRLAGDLDPAARARFLGDVDARPVCAP